MTYKSGRTSWHPRGISCGTVTWYKPQWSDDRELMARDKAKNVRHGAHYAEEGDGQSEWSEEHFYGEDSWSDPWSDWYGYDGYGYDGNYASWWQDGWGHDGGWADMPAETDEDRKKLDELTAGVDTAEGLALES